MTPDTPNEVVREVLIEAAPEVIFPYFTDPAKLVRWIGVAAALEPQPGGLFSVKINPERMVRGEYLEVVTPTYVVWSWGWEGRSDVPPGSSRVEITLTPIPGGTLLRLRHYNLPNEVIPLHTRSWEHNLLRLQSQFQQ